MPDSEPTGINKILIDKYGYEWINGKAWKPGAAPEATTSSEASPPLSPQPSRDTQITIYNVNTATHSGDITIVHNIRGTDQADKLSALGSNYNFYGPMGEYLEGLAGDDEIIGGPGLDVINGGTGDDTLSGGINSSNSLNSKQYWDSGNTFVFEPNFGNDTVTDFRDGFDNLVFQGFSDSALAKISEASNTAGERKLVLGDNSITFSNIYAVETQHLIDRPGYLEWVKESGIKEPGTIKFWIDPGGTSHFATDLQRYHISETPTLEQYSWMRSVTSEVQDRINVIFEEVGSQTEADIPFIVTSAISNNSSISSAGDYRDGLNFTDAKMKLNASNGVGEDWKQIFTHELGHLLGLEHPWDIGEGDNDIPVMNGKKITNQDLVTDRTLMAYEGWPEINQSSGFRPLDWQALEEIWGTRESASKPKDGAPTSPSLDIPDWVSPPPTDAIVTQVFETLTNPLTGEKFTVPTGGYTVNVSITGDIAIPEPTGVNKILVEKYGYEWVNGKAWKPGTAPEPETTALSEPKPTPELAPTPKPTTPSEASKNEEVISNIYVSGDLTSASIGNLETLFDRTLDVYGVKLVVAGEAGGQSAVPDTWAYKVAQSIKLILDPTAEGINLEAQSRTIETLKGADGTWHEGAPTLQRVMNESAEKYTPNPLKSWSTYGNDIENLFDTHMNNDMIWYSENGTDLSEENINAKVTEVLEHLMHTVHPYGVNGGIEGSEKALNGILETDTKYAESEIWLAMQEAISNGIYSLSGYDSTPPDFVAAKEYAYLLNFNMWEFGIEFWENGSLAPEWADKARTLEGIKKYNPLGYELFTTYFAPVLSKPDIDALRSTFQSTEKGQSGYIWDLVDTSHDLETDENSVPEPNPTTTPSYPEPTGINKILVEKYGYEWVNGKAWKLGTAPEPEVPASPEAIPTPEPVPEPTPTPGPEQATPKPKPTPEPAPPPAPSYPEPTGINKILVEKYGYEWVNGKAWKPGTAPDVEAPALPEPDPIPEPAPTPEPEQPDLTPAPTQAPEPSLTLNPELNLADIEDAPTGISKLLVEKYGYSWVEGQYYIKGTAPEVNLEGDAIHTVTVSKVGNQNVFFINGNSNPDFVIEAGKTYRFDQSDVSNTNHPLNFLSEAGSDITSYVEASGLAGNEGAYVEMRFEAGDIKNINGPELSYYCEIHSAAMGNDIEVTNIIA